MFTWDIEGMAVGYVPAPRGRLDINVRTVPLARKLVLFVSESKRPFGGGPRLW